MKRKQYSITFEMFWKSLDSYFPKGSKVEAYREFQKLECNQEDAVWIAGRYNEAVRLKRAVIEGRGWSAPIKHVCKYLKHEDFEPKGKTKVFILRELLRGTYWGVE